MPPTAAAPPRPSTYHDEEFIRRDSARGAVRDALGRRLVRVSADLLDALPAALNKEGANADDVLYRLGRRWGEADFKAFAARVPKEFGVAGLEQMHFNVMLEAWRRPLTAAGWGTWRYDFRRARAGLPVVELHHSAAVTGHSERPVCFVYAGLFAAVFSHLAKRELTGVELQCAATGSDCCRILIASAAKAVTAAQLPKGMSVEDVLDRLAGPADIQGNGQ
jgi:predicted hydrocarbon binding protein